MAKQIIIWFFVAAIGGSLIYFSAYLVEAFGQITWAENKLWGTRNGYLLVGFSLMVIGLLILFGVIPLDSPTEGLPAFNAAPLK